MESNAYENEIIVADYFTEDSEGCFTHEQLDCALVSAKWICSDHYASLDTWQSEEVILMLLKWMHLQS